MAEKELLQQHLAGMGQQLSSLDDLCDSARTCLAHAEDAFSAASANARAHDERLSEVEQQRYAALIKEAQDNLAIAVGAREQFHSKLQQLQDRIARL